MRFVGTCYRGHDPQWSFKPASGDGAAIGGARFNEIGIPTLYLGLSFETAVKEVTQGFGHKTDPMTYCCYDVDCTDILDLTDHNVRVAENISVSDMACAWKSFAIDGKIAPSQIISSRLIAAKIAGIIVPSYARGAIETDKNLVLWTWGAALPHKVSVYDPSGRLPKNQTSWA